MDSPTDALPRRNPGSVLPSRGPSVGFWQGGELGHPGLLMQLQGQLQCRSNT